MRCTVFDLYRDVYRFSLVLLEDVEISDEQLAKIKDAVIDTLSDEFEREVILMRYGLKDKSYLFREIGEVLGRPLGRCCQARTIACNKLWQANTLPRIFHSKEGGKEISATINEIANLQKQIERCQEEIEELRRKLDRYARTPIVEGFAAEACLEFGEVNIRLENLGFSLRNENFLRRNGVETLADIIACSPGTISQLHGVDAPGVERRMRELGYKDFVA